MGLLLFAKALVKHTPVELTPSKKVRRSIRPKVCILRTSSPIPRLGRRAEDFRYLALDRRLQIRSFVNSSPLANNPVKCAAANDVPEQTFVFPLAKVIRF